MTCKKPPVSISAFAQATIRWPGRSTASDGTCPSYQHHQQNAASDHEADPYLNFYSCAFDLTHDPAHGVDAHGHIADMIVARRDVRVKYLIRHIRPSYDEICGPNTGWVWRNAGQNQHASHLHVSLKHDMRILHDVSPWFGDIPAPPPVSEPKEPDVAVMAYPNEPLQRPKSFRGLRPTFMVDEVGQARLLTPDDVSLLLFLGAQAPVEYPREFIEGLHHLPRMDGKR